MNKIVYDELSAAKLSDTRSMVISSCSKGGFTIAQQIEAVEENGTSTKVFMKGAFHVDDLAGLYDIRDAINLAIKSVEENAAENTWDD